MSTDVRVGTVASLPPGPSASAVPPATHPEPTLASLPDDPVVLKRMIIELVEALKKSQHDCAGLHHRLDQLLRRLYGPKAERFDPNQPWLIPEMALTQDESPPAAPPPTRYVASCGRRKRCP